MVGYVKFITLGEMGYKGCKLVNAGGVVSANV